MWRWGAQGWGAESGRFALLFFIFPPLTKPDVLERVRLVRFHPELQVGLRVPERLLCTNERGWRRGGLTARYVCQGGRGEENKTHPAEASLA